MSDDILRSSWITCFVLSLYGAVNVGVAGVHGHAPTRAAAALALDAAAPGISVASSAAVDDEDACPICNILHIAKTLPQAAPHGAVGTLVSGARTVWQAFYTLPQTSRLHSRAPPV